MSVLSGRDREYLKEALGKPLTLALSEILGRKPQDPIHYLAQWLLKYRYNQEVDIKLKNELRLLGEERKRRLTDAAVVTKNN